MNPKVQMDWTNLERKEVFLFNDFYLWVFSFMCFYLWLLFIYDYFLFMSFLIWQIQEEITELCSEIHYFRF